MTETILDESAVSEIEARARKYKQLAERAATPADEDVIRWFAKTTRALCATVKHLRAESFRYKTGFDDYVRKLETDNERLTTGLVNLYHVITNQQCERKVALGMATSAVSSLQSQLEQLRAENERLLRGDFTDEELQGFCHNLSEQDRDAFFEGCTKYQERLFGTSAIAQLKENQ